MHSAVFSGVQEMAVAVYPKIISGVIIGIKCYESVTELMGFQLFLPKGKVYILKFKRLIGLGHSHFE